MIVYRLLILFVFVLLRDPAGAASRVVCGTGDDTAAVQAAVLGRQPLPAGQCSVSAPILVGTGQRLSGEGPERTYLIPTGPMSAVVRIMGPAAAVEDLQIGTWVDPYRADHGLQVGDGLMPFDRVSIRNVHISGRYSLAFACYQVVSSRMDFVQIWSFQADTFSAAFLGCSDWSNTQVEVHMQAPSPPGGALWLWFGSAAIRFFGGNVSTQLGQPGQYVVGPGGEFYGTTFYQEP